MKTALNLKTVYFYGDSLVYGWGGGMAGRYNAKQRFTGILQDLLGEGYDVIEDGLRSRTTDIDDPTLIGRNGLTSFCGNIAANLPANLAIIMLGTNDCKAYLNHDMQQVGPALQKYFEALKFNTDLFKMDPPKVLLVSPPLIDESHYDEIMAKFFGEQAPAKAKQLAPIIREVAQSNGAAFLDAAQVVGAGTTDGIHLSLEQNKQLAEALATEVKKLC
jgi:lysophospholipase L1-like esterase